MKAALGIEVPASTPPGNQSDLNATVRRPDLSFDEKVTMIRCSYYCIVTTPPRVTAFTF